MTDENKVLIVRHLPKDLDAEDCVDLLKHFGALHVRYMGKKGSMKDTAFATFESPEIATSVLQRLHQLEVLGTRLVVQHSSGQFSKYHPSDLEPIKMKPDKAVSDASKPRDGGKEKSKNAEKERKQQVTGKINSLCPSWDFEYPFNPKLQYMYPAPTITILMNIANALATVPRFYVQVLHLMNKMHLPAPFGLPTCIPPIPDGVQPPLPPDQVAPPQPAEDMEYSSTEESELESDGEDAKRKGVAAGKRPHRPSKKQSIKKKMKLQIQMDAQMQAIAGILPRTSTAAPNPTEIFDQTEHVAPRKIEFKLAPDSITGRSVHQSDVESTNEPEVNKSSENLRAKPDTTGSEPAATEVGGFGKLQPVVKPQTSDNGRDDEEFGKQDFISDKELAEGRLSEKEMKDISVFKKYETGAQSSRLYIKNLEKRVTEKDLHFIYGRYVDWDSESEKLAYDIRLMQVGRLKGQAFITLPSEEKAKAALMDSNGFMFNGKPMVVQFSRSAVPK